MLRDTARAPNFDRFERNIKEIRRFFGESLDVVETVLRRQDMKLTDWNRSRLRNIRSQIAQELKERMDTGRGFLRVLMEASYGDGLKILASSTGSESIVWNQIHTAKVEMLVNEMSRSISDSMAEIGRWVDDGMRQAQLAAATQAQIQGLSQSQQAAKLTDFISKDNLRLPRGFRGDLGSYVEMVARTNLAEANRLARQARGNERGVTLFWIQGHGATDTCKDFEETIFSSVPNDEGIPTYEELRRNKSHIFGPNCRHERNIPVTPRLFTEAEREEAIAKGKKAAAKFRR